MSELEYAISSDEKTILTERVDDIVARIHDNAITPQEFQDISRLLQVNQDNFVKYRAETWFKKAWIVVSGKRGQLADMSINNLGKVQLGVLKVMGEVLESSNEVHKDLLIVFNRLNYFEVKSIELKAIILKFNKKYDKRFQRLQKEIDETRASLKATQVILGLGCIAGATLIFVPGLKESYWHWGVICGTIMGGLLIGQLFMGIRKRRRGIPIKEHKQSDIPLNKKELVDQACEYLKLDEDLAEGPSDKRIFKIDGHIHNLIDYFKLSNEEQRLLFSIQYYLCNVDREKTADYEIKKKKATWLAAWSVVIEKQLAASLVTDTDVLFNGLSEVRQENIPMPKMGVLLFESVIFRPYFPLKPEESTDDLRFDQIDRTKQNRKLCHQLDFPVQLLKEAESANENALKEIPQKGMLDLIAENPLKILAGAVLIAITGGLAAPLIGGAIGAAMGLSGAAAVSAGLAFLGGGAIAAGGLGMAGGTVVLIGGGAILGAGATSGLIHLFSGSSHVVLRELAKMEAIAKVFFSSINGGDKIIEKIIEYEKNTAHELEKAYYEADANGDSDKKKELEIGARYCSRAIERLEAFVRDNPSMINR